MFSRTLSLQWQITKYGKPSITVDYFWVLVRDEPINWRCLLVSHTTLISRIGDADPLNCVPYNIKNYIFVLFRPLKSFPQTRFSHCQILLVFLNLLRIARYPIIASLPRTRPSKGFFPFSTLLRISSRIGMLLPFSARDCQDISF